MEKTETEQTPFSDFHHVGIVVRDVDKAAEHYESLGIGPFEPLIIYAAERRIRGELVDDLKLKIRMAHVGTTRFELIEPVGGKISLHKEFLESRAGGIHHLAFVVDDIDNAEAELVKKGLNLIFSSRFKNGGGAAYFQSDKPGTVLFELFQRPRDYVPRNKRANERRNQC